MNVPEAAFVPAALWLAVIASGVFHGLNPGMGWPLAVSAGLMESEPGARSRRRWRRSRRAISSRCSLVILPFALLVVLVDWERPIRIGASLLVIGFGAMRLLDRRHPRVLARIRPTQLGLWSFAVAIAHGAGLMLLPIYLGLCGASDAGERAAGLLINADLGMAVAVSAVHTAAMIAAGGLCAWLVFRHLGLKAIARSWFNLDAAWAASLVLVGTISLALAIAGPH